MSRRKRNHSNYETADLMDRLKSASAESQQAAIRSLTVERALALDADFECWAHAQQLPPSSGGWRTWLMMAGRGFGKTRAGAEWIFKLASGKPKLRIALVGGTIAEARSIMVEGVSGLLSIARRRRRRLQWEPSQGLIKWPNGSEAKLFSGDNADGLRGPEHDFAWCDELAKWREVENAWMNLQFGLRRGQRPRALVTTTPRPIALLRAINDDPLTIVTRGRTSDNVNVEQDVIDLLTASYGNSRIGRQELDGELLDDVAGTLWPRDLIERARVLPLHHPADGSPPRDKLGEEFDRIVVGVDPPARARDPMRAASSSPDRARARSMCSRTRACRGCAPKAGRAGSRPPRSAGERAWWWPKRTTAGRWSKACSRRRISRCACGWFMRAAASAPGPSRWR
jgi:phage terminase large subunit-like protein